ncbi:MAG: hypothetical protein PHW07_02995 [Sulfurospirillaceae bacterium]|nr:hypothetical protein [Sulfurospirillaceae bacterium]
MKKIATFLCVALLIQGCSEKEDKKESNATLASQNKAGKIEVVQNDDFKVEKVKVKEKDANESKTFYYDYNQKDVGNAQQKEDKTYTSIDANMRVRSPYEHVEISMIVSKLSKNFILKCSACHDDYANGIVGPSLLDKDSDFIYGTIAKYRQGGKVNILMKELVMQMKDEEIRVLADEIYTFNKKIKELREKRK